MNDLDRFLNWYLGERTKMGRGLFNAVFFLSMLPVFFIQVTEFAGGASEKANQFAPMVGLMRDMTQGGNHFDARDVEGVLEYTERSHEAMDGLMEGFGIRDDFSYQPPKTKSSFNKIALINILIYIVLVPIVMMRLRDLAKWGNTLYVYTGLVYSGIALDAFKNLFGLTLPLSLSVTSGALTFILLSWLCMAQSKVRKPSQRSAAENQMPGDSPDDPY